MRTIVRGINVDLSKAIVKHSKDKFQNISRYFDNLSSLELIFSNNGKRAFQIEALVKMKGHTYIVKLENEDLYKGIDQAKLKMKELLIKEKNKIIDKKRRSVA